MDKENLKKIGAFLVKNPFSSLFDPNPDNHPNIIYKYRNWREEFHKNLILKNEIFLSSPNNLNDPFDCRIFSNYQKHINSIENKKEFIKNSISKNLRYLKEHKITTEEAENILNKRLEDTLKFQVRSEVIEREFNDKHIGVTCFSEVWNSILMWSHYGDNHSGYCVGFDEKLIRYSQIGKLMRVNYSNEYPDLNPILKNKNSDEIKFFLKSTEWSYEREIRLISLYNESNPKRLINLDNDVIKEVIIGLNTSKKDKEEIVAIAKDKGIDVWQAVKGEFEFKIERYKL
ncbi:MAG: DUF2971 domain-containing protein [Flavobacterium sp.]|uniref:DUF2971 domain-containing protein n=1 Tax=Flavobacterium sp. TaxID=239 RepID=UPI0025BBE327|nr:DUF2971 domain-containing protein [Flavobacterium sp.]MCA1965298.1 DUF2971 domain-containing protein [Flavobacterium sp.]